MASQFSLKEGLDVTYQHPHSLHQLRHLPCELTPLRPGSQAMVLPVLSNLPKQATNPVGQRARLRRSRRASPLGEDGPHLTLKRQRNLDQSVRSDLRNSITYSMAPIFAPFLLFTPRARRSDASNATP